ncbi:hypothetical protein DFAR_2910047 [Desulfarculales bacterium]
MLRAADGGGMLTEKQQQTLTELETDGFATVTAWRLKKILRWIKKATSVRATQSRFTHFTRHARKCIANAIKTLAPVLKALMTLEEHAHLILSRWIYNHFSARLEEFNGFFQAARARATDYRNVFTFMAMIYIHRRTTGGTRQLPPLTTKNRKN